MIHSTRPECSIPRRLGRRYCGCFLTSNQEELLGNYVNAISKHKCIWSRSNNRLPLADQVSSELIAHQGMCYDR